MVAKRRSIVARSAAVSIFILSTAAGCAVSSSLDSQDAPESAASARQQLAGHLTPEMKSAPLVGSVARSTVLTMTVGLPVRDAEGMRAAAASVSDPGSPDFRRYITPTEFADTYGASPADYQKVLDWAHAKNLTVVAHPNRLVVEVRGPVPVLEAALHVHLNYALRPDGSQFYAPDAEPSLDLDVPVDHVGNLENYVLPRPANGGGGSGPGGSRQGNDFRNAYASCSQLTGAGQTIGILMLDNFSQSDVDAYFSGLSLPLPLPVLAIPAGTAGGAASLEGNLDVHMTLSMAPAAQVVVFTGARDVILTNMAEASYIKQLSSSWFTGALDSSATASLAQMALQGQSFFQASGDQGAFPVDYFNASGPGIRQQPNVTVVGGTALSMAGSGASYSSETAWPGSSGGVINYAVGGGEAIPAYQADLATSANQGSSVYRNLPDVSAEASDVNIILNGAPSQVGGTSAATPIWAGFMALVNQQAGIDSRASVGFVNPALYSLASVSASYQADFNDITSGTNPTSSNSSGIFYSATPGYDLVTGLGSPKCGLIDALAGSGSCEPRQCSVGFIQNQVTCDCERAIYCLSISCCVRVGGAFGGERCLL